MTQKILKSTIAGFTDFGVMVAAHAKEMRDWRAQMKLAAEHKGNDKIAPIDRYVERPVPTAHPLVESAVNESDDVDYEVVDDGPTADQVLKAKKSLLTQAVLDAERRARLTVVPAGKQRAFSIRLGDVTADDTTRMGDLMARFQELGILDKFTKQRADLIQKIKNPEATHAQGRPAADHKFMLEHADRQQRISSLERWGAQAMSDIEDLTADNIDAWSMPPLPDVTKKE